MNNHLTFIVNVNDQVLCLQCMREPADFITSEGKPFSRRCFSSLEQGSTPVSEYLQKHPETKLIKESELFKEKEIEK